MLHSRELLINFGLSLAITALGTFAIVFYLLCDLPEIVQ